MTTREICQTSTVVAFLAVLVMTSAASAQTDEIQVYDGALTEPGVFNLMVHNNFTPNGQKTPAFPVRQRPPWRLSRLVFGGRRPSSRESGGPP
jgi:hypothetical protein